jgi:5-enolpyruvylshikimate-3-phosphate synthase
MPFAIASLVATSDILVKNPECVEKSYPGFLEEWKSLMNNE